MSRKYSQEQIDQAIELYLEDKPLAEIERLTTLRPKSVRYWLRRRGIEPSHKGAKGRYHLPDWRRKQIIDMYAIGGYSVRYICDNLNTCSKTVIGILRSNNIERRTRSEQIKIMLDDRAVQNATQIKRVNAMS